MCHPNFKIPCKSNPEKKSQENSRDKKITGDKRNRTRLTGSGEKANGQNPAGKPPASYSKNEQNPSRIN